MVGRHFAPTQSGPKTGLNVDVFGSRCSLTILAKTPGTSGAKSSSGGSRNFVLIALNCRQGRDFEGHAPPLAEFTPRLPCRSQARSYR